MNRVARFAPLLAFLALGILPARATGGDSGFGNSLSGIVVAGLAHGTGERSWIDGGFGKLDVGQDQTEAAVDGVIAWRPSLTQRLGAVVSVSTHLGETSTAGIDEAYLTLRSDPGQAWRLSGRAGLFSPPASLEHDGSEWGLIHTLTPSALNSWIAEEVKTAGIEATLRGTLAGRQAGLTVAAFQGNDTAGALLAFRGWALHDRRATLGGGFGLAPLAPLFQGGQAQKSNSIDEVDGRVGVYARADITLSERASASLFAYDNRGDRRSIVAGQYAWRTRFVQAGLRWVPSPGTEILVQAVSGNSAMGEAISGQYPADIGFSGAYGLVSRTLGSGALTVRLDQFAIDDRTFKALDNNAEHGWGATASWSQPLADSTDFIAEGVFVQSDRPARLRVGIDRSQGSLETRIAVRTRF